MTSLLIYSFLNASLSSNHTIPRASSTEVFYTRDARLSLELCQTKPHNVGLLGKVRPRIDHREDNCFGVQDARKRKQIQDRLAQRAHRHRKRLAERHSSLDSDEINDSLDSSKQISVWNRELIGCENFTISQDIAMLQYPSPSNSPASDCEIPVETGRGLVLSVDHFLMPHDSISVYTALYNNGRILGIPCSCTAASKSRPAGPNIPLSLRPIPLQLETVHYELIDRFPFPRMRYNMISLFDYFSIEDFVADLFMTSTFTIKPRGQSWDPTAWRIDVDFKAKWGFLLAGSIKMNDFV